METAETVILDALKEIVAIPAEAAVDTYKAQAGMFYLNLMMFELSSVGVNLGYTAVNSLGDPITVVDGAIEGIVKNLAIEISPLFKGTLTSPDLFEEAVAGLDTLRQISYDSPANSPFSSNLPIGSGNERWNTARFFNEQETPILTENYGNIAPESV